jgi:hypothetical protein
MPIFKPKANNLLTEEFIEDNKYPPIPEDPAMAEVDAQIELAGLSMVATNREECDRVIRFAKNIQSEIEDIVNIASSEIRRREGLLLRLLSFQGPRLQALCPKWIEKDKNGKARRKYYTTADLSARIYFRKSGGWTMVDPDALQTYLNELPEEDFKQHGGEIVRKLDWRQRAELLKDGVHLPGCEYKPIDEWGSMKIGDEKPFSPTKLKEKLSAALRGGSVELEETY